MRVMPAASPLCSIEEEGMKYIGRVVQWVSLVGRNFGAAFLLSVVAIMCANVAYRAIGGIIPGTFDLVELLIIPAIGFALVTVELQRGHVVVDMVTIHLPSGLRSLLQIFMSVVSLFYWGAVCWAAWMMMLRKMATGEHTQLLQVSVIPFRAVWVFSLAWVCVVIIVNIRGMFKGSSEKRCPPK